ncbi:MAG TPA: DUF1932 domain-containing protein [Acidimicrobiia bacterium]|nr:DUF1932 domain-containing protein [Acidimicrobiia bacterium]
MSDLGSLESVVTMAEALVSVCPPGSAIDVAEKVRALGFDGLYVDVNAVSPDTARRIGELFARFVDGGIVGPPPEPRPATRDRSAPAADTRLYLSGEEASVVAEWFAGSAVDARVVGPEPGRASAVKMAYAAWTKGSSALLLSVAALAGSEEVTGELFDEWDSSLPELRERLEQVSGRIGRKAWRFVAEMEEIARTYGDAGLPDGFHIAAADIYARLADLKGHLSEQNVEEISRLLLDRDGGP